MNDAGPDTAFSVKMRASSGGRHISGAERIVGARDVEKTLVALSRRALSHDRGEADFVNFKVVRAEGVRTLDALRVTAFACATPEEGWDEVVRVLASAGIARAAEIRELFSETYGMRGAMVLDPDTLERLEPDRVRGVRVSAVDSDPSPSAAAKCHYAEAVALATKVLAAPGVVAEICVSDDPDYVTGYVSTRDGGYRRISCLKRKGEAVGGRIFLYRGARAGVADAISFLAEAPVRVRGVPALAASASEARFEGLERELAERRARGLERVVEVRRAPLVSFASNDYLGLARDPRVTDAAARAAREYGAGAGASRLVTGTLPPHVALERHLADFKRAEDAIVFSTGYMANLGAVTALAGRGDVVLSDALNHASIIDACRMSGAEVVVYRHLDMGDLERRLSLCGAFRRRLVVSDGVFSMDGDRLDLGRFVAACRRHDAFSMVDEAHSVGVVGAGGRGLCELAPGCSPDVMMGTLSKALGSQGGYVAGRRTLVEYLRQTSRPFIFNTAPNPSAMAAADVALGIVESEPERVRRLQANAAALCRALGLPPPQSAIVPVVVGAEREAVRVSRRLEELGFLVPAIRYPTVAPGAARLRVALSAGHTEAQITALAAALRAAVAAGAPSLAARGGDIWYNIRL